MSLGKISIARNKFIINLFGFEPLQRRLLAAAARRTLADRKLCSRAVINFILIPDLEIKKLNGRYRKVRRITDVISFLIDHRIERSDCSVSGDIYIAEGRSKKQARACGHSWERELEYLVIHGVLHLMGYTDYTPREKTKMFAIQDKLWGSFPIA